MSDLYYIVPILNTLLLLVALFLAFFAIQEIPSEKLGGGRQAWLRLVLTIVLAGLMLNPLNVIANHLTSWFLQPDAPPETRYSILAEGLGVVAVLYYIFRQFSKKRRPQ